MQNNQKRDESRTVPEHYEQHANEKSEKKQRDPLAGFLIVLLCLTVAGLIAMAAFVAFSPEPRERAEQPHLYWKDIPVEVVSVDQRTWFAGTRHYRVAIKVKNDEYGLEETIEESGSGFYGMPASWNLKKGDVVDAEMYSWVLDSTGEVQRRSIHRLIL